MLVTRRGNEGMSSDSRIPDNWFIDPVLLGVAGAYSNDLDENPLAWQGGSTRDAKKICAGCDVKAQCLEYALANDERFGIWGGLSERERRKLKKLA